MLEKVERHGRMIAEALDVLREHPHVGDVRRRGLMTGIELVASRSPWTPFDPRARVGYAVCMAARDRGVIIRPLGDTVILMPMPGMQTESLTRLLEVVVEVIEGFDYP